MLILVSVESILNIAMVRILHQHRMSMNLRAFGNMLLRRTKRWCEQNLSDNQEAVPYINVIKYRGQVVGATAPESLLFTSTGYYSEASVERPWIDVATGKFINPLNLQ